eukprot:jgi/Botrbrau1/682/Bobra.160_2s0006.1
MGSVKLFKRDEISLASLNSESLYDILKRVDPLTVAQLSCCCTHLRDVTADVRLWKSFVQRRWRNVNEGPFTRMAKESHDKTADPIGGISFGYFEHSSEECPLSDRSHRASEESQTKLKTNWRGLYSTDNGWKGKFSFKDLLPDGLGFFGFHSFTSLEVGWTLPGGNLCDDCIAVTEFFTEDLSGDATWLRVFTLGGESDREVAASEHICAESSNNTQQPGASLAVQAPKTSFFKMEPRLLTKLNAHSDFKQSSGSVLAVPGQPLFALGMSDGSTQLLALETDGTLQHVLDLLPTEASNEAASLMYCKERGSLYSLNYSDYAPGQHFRNSILAYDLETGRCTGRALELFEDRDIWCMCPGEDLPSWNQTLVAGTTHAGCDTCSNYEMYPSLCFHKAGVQTAGICIFDLRASLPMVSRYSTHHRSLFPRIALARSHYLFTSHAGNPLCVWDLRQMSVQVYEEERLGSYSAKDPYLPEKYPLGPPDGPSSCQGLYLDTDGDVLLGRADNGMVWKWDLSRTLGWADGSGNKSWLNLGMPSTGEADRFTDWPTPLGAWPVGDEVANIQLKGGGSPACLVGPVESEQGCNSIRYAYMDG